MRLPLVLVVGLALGAQAGRALAQDAPDMDKLVADLGADDCNKRDEAQKKLEALGKNALPALEKAEKESKDAEVRARAHEAILAIRKNKPAEGTEKDQEREGPPLSPERRLAPRGPQPDPSEGLDDFMKLFEGQRDPMMRDLPKILERLQKQMQGLDEEFQKELKRPRDRGNFRVYKFGMRSKTPVEEKLGLTVNPPSEALQAQLEISPADGGLVVEELAENGRAWKAGLKLYDVVLSIDGKAIRNPLDLKGLGEKDAKLEVIRKAKHETLAVHAQTDQAPEKAPEKKKDEPSIRKF